MRRKWHTLNIVILVLTIVNLQQTPPAHGAGTPDSDSVAEAVQQLIHPGSLHAAYVKLRDLPSEQVVSELARALEDPDFRRSEAATYKAYELLMLHHACRYDSGVELLLARLDDPLTRSFSLRALEDCPESVMPVVVRELIAYLRAYPDSILTSNRIAATLITAGEKVKPTANAFEKLLGDESLDSHVRLIAANVLLSSGRLDVLLAETTASDDEITKIAIHALSATSVPRSQGIFGLSEVQRTEVARFLMKSIRSGRTTVRVFAIKMGPPIIYRQWYGKLRSPAAGPYVDSLQTALSTIAASDPEVEIRESAKKALSECQVFLSKQDSDRH